MRELAKSLNITEQNLQNKLNVDDIKVSFLLELSQILGKDINFFLDSQKKLSNSQKQTIIGDNNIQTG